MEFDEELLAYGDFYEITWIERRGHRAPRFSNCLWNNFQSSLEDGIQTNNMLESFNKTWNRLAGKYSSV